MDSVISIYPLFFAIKMRTTVLTIINLFITYTKITLRQSYIISLYCLCSVSFCVVVVLYNKKRKRPHNFHYKEKLFNCVVLLNIFFKIYKV